MIEIQQKKKCFINIKNKRSSYLSHDLVKLLGISGKDYISFFLDGDDMYISYSKEPLPNGFMISCFRKLLDNYEPSNNYIYNIWINDNVIPEGKYNVEEQPITNDGREYYRIRKE